MLKSINHVTMMQLQDINKFLASSMARYHGASIDDIWEDYMRVCNCLTFPKGLDLAAHAPLSVRAEVQCIPLSCCHVWKDRVFQFQSDEGQSVGNCNVHISRRIVICINAVWYAQVYCKQLSDGYEAVCQQLPGPLQVYTQPWDLLCKQGLGTLPTCTMPNSSVDEKVSVVLLALLLHHVPGSGFAGWFH